MKDKENGKCKKVSWGMRIRVVLMREKISGRAGENFYDQNM
jgi:hypothetical protein